MERQFSFYALLGTALLAGVLFFNVVQPFLMPLFLAAILALLVRPVYDRCCRALGGHRYWTAALVTLGILLLGLLPLAAALLLVGQELLSAGQRLIEVDWQSHPTVARSMQFIEQRLGPQDWDKWRNAAATAVQGMTTEVYDRTTAIVSNLIGFVIGLGVVAMGLFYFLAEGPGFVAEWHRLSPFKQSDDYKLLEELDRVCRSVVVASVVCALVQAVLGGIGYAICGVPQVWLLSGLTMIAALIPFIGSAGVWVPAAIWLLSQGEYVAGLGLALYGGLIVSMSDNLIRAYVVHEGAHLHPLVALISVLGALQYIGLWGVFIGPVVAAFFYSLVTILRDRIRSQGGEPAKGPTPAA